jgi:hypothetical protein
MPLKTYSTREVADMFSKQSDWWLAQGCREGKFPHLRVGRQMRFTDAHIEEITALLEQRPTTAKPVEAAPDVSAFGATKRSQARHRTRKAS